MCPPNLGTPKPVVFLTKHNQQQNPPYFGTQKCRYIYCINKPFKTRFFGTQKTPCPPENPPVFFVESRGRPDPTPTPTLLPLAKVKMVKKYSATPKTPWCLVCLMLKSPGCCLEFCNIINKLKFKVEVFFLDMFDGLID